MPTTYPLDAPPPATGDRDMMDITERLRNIAVRYGAETEQEAGTRRIADAKEAADEIERLRNELTELREDLPFVTGWNDGFEHALTETVNLQFPIMLRKMWSGSEVQKWIDNQKSQARVFGAKIDRALTQLRAARIAGLREAAAIAGQCFGPKDEALTVSEAQGYDLAMGRIADAITARADELETET